MAAPGHDTKHTPLPPVSSPTAAPSSTPATKPTAPAGNALAALAPGPVIELQDQPTFKPSDELAAYLKAHKHAPVKVKFGGVSKEGGAIEIGTHDGKSFHTVDSHEIQSIPIDHPFIHTALEKSDPRLRIRIADNKVGGYAAPKKMLGSIEAIDKLIAEATPALGLAGFDLGHPNFQNKIDNGVFKLGTEHDITVSLAGWIAMSLGFGLVNDTVRLSAKGKVKVRGLAEADLEVKREAGITSGKAELAVNIAKFSGKATATYVNGEVTVVGTLSYSTEKLRGSLTLVVMEAAEAEKQARAQIDPQNLVTEAVTDREKGAKPDKFKKGERGIAGWGELDFAFTDWFTGKAKAIFGPAGYITIIGKIAPPKSVELMHEKPFNKRLFGLDLTARYGVPYVADIHVGISVELGASARIGPAVLTDISVEGTYSTDPTVLNAFAISGAFRLSAYAGLNLRFEGKAGLTILGHDIDFGAAITGKAGIKGYAEARPTIGYREKADPTAGKKGEYFIKGHMEIAAQPFVGLDGELFVKLDSPWWSPAPNKTWTWPLFSLEYPLPGEFGVAADVDYVLGSSEFPEIKWGKADFDSSKFTDSLLDDHIPPKKVGGDVEKPGSWKGEAPPPPTAPPTPVKPGKVPGTTGPKAGSPSATPGKGGGQKPEESANVPKTPDTSKRWLEGMKALGDLHQTAEKSPETSGEIHANLEAIKKKFGFSKLDAQLQGDYWVIDAALNPDKAAKKPTVKAKTAADGDKSTDDAPADLPARNSRGQFIDAVLEASYQAYRTRKKAADETPRGRLDWKQRSDWWKNNSTIARGNDFNKTVRRRRTYPYHEVNLIDGTRLDSYTLEGEAGAERISRKATDFNKVSSSLFDEYLDEFKAKYPVGKRIRTNQYPELDNQPLRGVAILEVPAVNENPEYTDRRDQLEARARSKRVKLRYTDE